MASGTIGMYDITKTYEGKLEFATYTNRASNSSTMVITGSIRKRVPYTVATDFLWDLIVFAEDGSEVFFRYRMDDRYLTVDSEYVEVFSYSETIPHRADGSQTVRIECSIWTQDEDATGEEQGVSTGVVMYEADGEYRTEYRFNDEWDYPVTLDTIIRPATITSAPNIDDNSTMATVSYSNPMGSYVSSLEVCIANSTGTQILVPYRPVNLSSTSYTFQLTSTERQALVNAVSSGTSMGIRYYIKTRVYETDHYSHLPKTYTLTSAMPTIAPGVADMNDTTIALTGDSSKFIRYCSTAAVSINAVAKKGATIAKTYVANGSFNSDENVNGIYRITGVDSGTFEVSATDSRGNTVSQTLTRTLIPYVKVSCNLTVAMELAGSTGATATLHIRGNYYNGSFGAVSNIITLQYRIGDSNGVWGGWEKISVPTSAMSNDQYSIDYEITGLNYKEQYRFQCYVADKLSSVYTDTTTSTLQPIFDWSATDFNFNVPVSFQSEYTMNDYIIDRGTAAMGTNGTWYWYKYKSGRAECYGYRNFGNMGVSTAFGALYRSTAFTQPLPQDVFLTNVVPDYININVMANGTGWICRDASGYSPSYSTTGSFYVVSPTSGNQSAVWLSFHVKGRWK